MCISSFSLLFLFFFSSFSLLACAAPGAVSNFVVLRTTDKKTVQAKWDKVETTPPVGVVAVYQIEYRQYSKKSVSSIKNSADQTTVTISNVVNSDSYEVCGICKGVLCGWELSITG